MALAAPVATGINAAYDGAGAKASAGYPLAFDYARVGGGANRQKVYVWRDWNPCTNQPAPGEIWARVFPNPTP